MTGAEFSGVDIDLLADYVGGALDGTPDEAVVAALINEDPAWREAHELLAGGVAAVTGQLRALSAEPMPADVFARLDAALAAAGPAAIDGPAETTARSETTAGPAVTEPGTDGAAPVRHLVAVPSGSRSKRARRLRWAAPVGIAAGVLAFLGFGLQQLPGGSSEDAATSAAGAPAEQAVPRAAAELALPDGPVPVTESGTDYRRDTLSQAAPRPMMAASGDGGPSDFRKSLPDATAAGEASPELDRLRVQEALRACLEAIEAQHGAGEITPQVIDFARFDGAPALIVEFTTTAGSSWVWASGPACGTRGVGADKLASVKVG